MKKRMLALVCAVTLTFAMSMTAFAAPSPTAGNVIGSGSPSASQVTENTTNSSSSDSSSTATATPATATPAPAIVATLASGQVITTETLATYVSTTTLTTDVAGATIGTVTTAQAATLATQAAAKVGANAVIATMVDISVPAGTGTAAFTLNVSGLVAGQSVSVLHLRSDGVVESLPVSNVSDGSVTFTMSSYSPVAVVTNATAPKTEETFPMGTVVAIVAALGCAVYAGKKFATR